MTEENLTFEGIRLNLKGEGPEREKAFRALALLFCNNVGLPGDLREEAAKALGVLAKDGKTDLRNAWAGNIRANDIDENAREKIAKEIEKYADSLRKRGHPTTSTLTIGRIAWAIYFELMKQNFEAKEAKSKARQWTLDYLSCHNKPMPSDKELDRQMRELGDGDIEMDLTGLAELQDAITWVATTMKLNRPRRN